jgi:hypothetical protein
MKNYILSLMLICFSTISGFAQLTTVQGVVKDSQTLEPMSEVVVEIEGSILSTTTNQQGEFSFSADVPDGNQTLILTKTNYLNLYYPIVITSGELVDIG